MSPRHKAGTVRGPSRHWMCRSAPIPGEKRKLPESLTLEDAKRIRVMGDIPMELVNEVMLTITDPAAMLGPEVWAGDAGAVLVLFSTHRAASSVCRGGVGLPQQRDSDPPMPPDQPAVGQRGAGRDGAAGGAPWHHRVPRYRQLALAEIQQEDPDVAGGAAECLLAPAAPHAQGVHHSPRL